MGKHRNGSLRHDRGVADFHRQERASDQRRPVLLREPNSATGQRPRWLNPPTDQSDMLVEAVRSRAVFWCKAAGEELGIEPGTDNCEEAIEADGFPHMAGSCPYWLSPDTDGYCPPIEPGDTGDLDGGDEVGMPDMMGDETDSGPVVPPQRPWSRTHFRLIRAHRARCAAPRHSGHGRARRRPRGPLRRARERGRGLCPRVAGLAPHADRPRSRVRGCRGRTR